MFDLKQLYWKEKKKDMKAALHFVKKAVDFFFLNRIASILTRFSHLSLLSWTLIHLIYFIKFPSKQLVLDFGYSFFAIIFVFYTLSINYSQRGEINKMEMFMENYFWNLESCGSEVYENIRRRTLIGKKIGLIHFTIGIINGLVLLPFESDRVNLFFFLNFSKKYFERFYSYYKHIFFICIIWSTVVATNQINYYLHPIIHLDLQYKLIIHHVKNIEEYFENAHHKRDYNQEICRRLIICASHFQKLSEFRKDYVNLLQNAMFGIVWIGVGVSIFIAYNLLVIKNTENIIALSALWIAVAEGTIIVSLIGQHFIDMAKDLLSALNNCLWYKWSTSNRKSYLILLSSAQNYKVIMVGGLIPFDLTLAIWVGRRTLSALTFFRAVRKKDH